MAEHTADADAREMSWPVKMAQFVPPPSAHAFSSALPFFKKRRSSHLPGTWLSSKSFATVTLSSSGLAPSIALILQGHVHEEHFLSTLAFTWPRFQDENGDTSSPGRVILASYKKICTDEQLLAGHSGVSKDIHNVDNPLSQVENLKSYSSGMNTAVVGHGAGLHQATRAKSLTLRTDVLPLSELSANVRVQGEQGHSTGFNKKSSPLVLPPRFPLQNHPFRAIGCEQQKGENPTIIAEGLHNEQNLEEKIKAYFLDPEFLGFVDRVERIWHAMEDDMATEISMIQS